MWKSSATSVSSGDGRGTDRDRRIDVLDDPGVQPGTTGTWKIKIIQAGTGLRVGVVVESSQTYQYGRKLGDTDSSWGYGGHGDAWHNGRRVWMGGWHVGFDSGSIVTLHLDLTKSQGEGGGGGTMSVSVDGKAMIQLFDGMDILNTYYPAAYLLEGSSIEFLGFHWIDGPRLVRSNSLT